ncbi:MAG: c-type cytochrome biogenesis protein CcmI [Marinobacter sp.]|nr:c-type cytochrome biogenesis protein CcmI [Marinobacter sp.]
MTTEFWLIAAVLVTLALVFLLYPVFTYRPDRRVENDLRNQNLTAYKGRLAELEAELTAGLIDEASFQQMRDELAGSLLDDEEEGKRAPAGRRVVGRRSAYAVVLVSGLLIPLTSVWLYQNWGAMPAWNQYLAMQELSQPERERAQEFLALAEELRRRLEESPRNPEGWAMLGRTYMTLERYGQAAWAFERLAEQVAEDPRSAATAWGLAAQAQFFRSQGDMTPAVMDAISAARELDPDEVNALGLLGINAFERREFQRAIEYWERIVAVAPEHPQLSSIREGIRTAYDRLGQETPASAANGTAIRVEVLLSEQFQADVPEGTTLFVYARDAKGSPMPLAAARLTAAQLPVALTLDDSMSMVDGVRLSDADEVLLVARLSRSGTAQLQPGDWQGVTESPLDLQGYDGSPIRILINEQIPQ